jgi:hypothetical protein
LRRSIRNLPFTETGQVGRTFDFFFLLDRKRDNMAFHYGKVSSESSDDTLEGQQIRRDPSYSSIWIRICTAGRWICWPVTFLLLLTVLGCELSLMYSRPSSQEIGGEINQIVPGCKYSAPTSVCFATQRQRTNVFPVSQEQRRFRADSRFASDHRTVKSINTSQQEWRDIMPCE